MRRSHVFEVEVFLNGLDPKSVQVELYADGINGSVPDAAGNGERAGAARRGRPVRLSRRSSRDAFGGRLHGASEPAAPRGGGAARVRSNPVATMIGREGLMKKATPITCLFLDIGGVLFTNGWDHHARRRAAAHFKLQLSRNGGSASPDFRHLRGGKAHAGRISRSDGLLPKATVHAGSVSTLHVRAIETVPQDDRTRPRGSRSGTG